MYIVQNFFWDKHEFHCFNLNHDKEQKCNPKTCNDFVSNEKLVLPDNRKLQLPCEKNEKSDDFNKRTKTIKSAGMK